MQEMCDTMTFVLLFVSVLFAVLIMCLILALVLAPVLLQCDHHYLRRTQRQQVSKELKIAQRQKMIDKWLISKDALHGVNYGSINTNETLNTRDDDNGNQETILLQQQEQQYSSTTTTTMTPEMTAGLECVICMEPFCIGDKVSWSPNSNCRHAYHHACVREWLVDHRDCPCCRRLFLPIDNRRRGLKQTAKMKFIMDMIRQRRIREEQTQFCIENGIISVHNQENYEQAADHLDQSSLP